MVELQNSNRRILCNLLPTHVAAHFIDNQHNSHTVSALTDTSQDLLERATLEQ